MEELISFSSAEGSTTTQAESNLGSNYLYDGKFTSKPRGKLRLRSAQSRSLGCKYNKYCCSSMKCHRDCVPYIILSVVMMLILVVVFY